MGASGDAAGIGAGVRLARALALALVPGAAAVLLACGGAKQPAASVPTVPTPTVAAAPASGVDAQPPANLTTAQRPRFVADRAIVGRTGCLACHRIGTTGKDAPGHDLTLIGGTLTPQALRRALLTAKASMPSYAKLPKRDLDALVAFLSQLRPTAAPARSPCGSSDCV